jgi:hypothetical protein
MRNVIVSAFTDHLLASGVYESTSGVAHAENVCAQRRATVVPAAAQECRDLAMARPAQREKVADFLLAEAPISRVMHLER